MLLLATGGYRIPLLGVPAVEFKLTVAVIVLLALLAGRFALRRRSLAPRVFAGHAPFLLLALALIVYLANGSSRGVWDSRPARFLALHVLVTHDFYLDDMPRRSSDHIPTYMRRVDGHLVSDYPVGAVIAALPFSFLAGVARLPSAVGGAAALEKLSAASIVASSVVLTYLALIMFTSRGMALAIALVYAFGSSSLSESSQALWQHGPSQLGLAAAIYCLARARSEFRWLAGAGFALGFACLCRPGDALIAIPLGIYVLIYHRRDLTVFVLGGVPALVFAILYNAHYFGNPLHLEIHVMSVAAARNIGVGDFSLPLGEGLAGLLFSPARGLFIYSPIFLFSVVGLAAAWRRGGDALLRSLGVGALAYLLVTAKWRFWWGGFSYGPRLLADITPILAFGLYPVGELLRKSRTLLGVFALLAVASVTAHAVGAFMPDIEWNKSVPTPAGLWWWRDNQLVDPIAGRVDALAIALRRIPTSRSAPGALAASCTSTQPPYRTLAPKGALSFEMECRNDGDAVWLAREDQGSVVLAYDWLAASGRELSRGGTMPLRKDVFPGGAQRFFISLRAPREPGTYRFRIGLVVLRGDSATALGTAASESVIEVTPAPP
jgi:hypothetical protein